MKTKLLSIALLASSFASAQLYTPAGTVQTSSTNYIGIGTNAPQASLDINANSNIPIIRGNGDYIPTGLRFIDDSIYPGWSGEGVEYMERKYLGKRIRVYEI